MSEEVEAAFAALSALGAAWRGDWSDFDGRTLRGQLDSWETLMRGALAGERTVADAETWLRDDIGICPKCYSWDSWCDNPSEHAA